MSGGKARIEIISVNNSSYSKTAYFTINHGNSEGNTTIRLDKEDAEQFISLAMTIFERRKNKIIKQMEDIELSPLLGYDRDKTIDNDVPF